MLSLDCNHLPTLLCLTTYFFLLIYSLFPSSLSLHPSSVLAISIHGDTQFFVGGGVTKASGCSPRQMALRGWLESWNGHLQKYILKVKTGSHLNYENKWIFFLIIKFFLCSAQKGVEFVAIMIMMLLWQSYIVQTM